MAPTTRSSLGYQTPAQMEQLLNQNPLFALISVHFFVASPLGDEPSMPLSMSIIKTIVEWHGGKIWLESEENKSTTFFIELPKE